MLYNGSFRGDVQGILCGGIIVKNRLKVLICSWKN